MRDAMIIGPIALFVLGALGAAAALSTSAGEHGMESINASPLIRETISLDHSTDLPAATDDLQGVIAAFGDHWGSCEEQKRADDRDCFQRYLQCLSNPAARQIGPE